MLYHESLAAGKRDAPFHNIFQFADIARETVCHQEVHCFRLHLTDIFFYFPGVFFDKVVDQQGDIAFSCRKRRQMQRDDVDAIIEILPEMSLVDLFQEVAIGGADKTDINLARSSAADPHDFPLLNDPEQFHLHIGTHLGDLIQKQGAAMGHFHQT